MLIDTHCHLDAAEFDGQQAVIIQQALNAGVSAMVVPAVDAQNFQTVIKLAQQYKAVKFALGIHPMYIDKAAEADLQRLADLLAQHADCVAVGEIGLDYFVTRDNQARQQFFFSEQLKLAQHFDLPVILHVRGAVDDVLKYVRRHPVKSGIAHAFNGSLQQAHQLIELGFKLGFGGAVTYTRALHLRRLLQQLPLESIVLETDAPDIPPAWLEKGCANSPKELMKIANLVAEIKGVEVMQLIDVTRQNACAALPKLAHLFTQLNVTDEESCKSHYCI